VSETGEGELIARAQAGDRRALEALLLREQPRVYHYGLRMCRDAADAEDVTQETLLAAARGLRGFRGAAALSTWLYTIARSVCIKRRRRRKAAPAPEATLGLEAAGEVADPRPAPDETAAGSELAAGVARALARLEPRQREVVLLRDMEGLSAPEVAQALGLSVQAVKSRLHRARVALRAELAPLVGRPLPLPPVVGRLCPGVLSFMSRHLEGDVAPRTCAEMEAHIAACDWCRRECAALKDALALCREASEPMVPAHVRASLRAVLRGLGAAPGAVRSAREPS
jgi:RNA polymerase sigma-70 factor (ECF subfamily)